MHPHNHLQAQWSIRRIHRTQHVVILMSTMNYSKRIQMESVKEKSAWNKALRSQVTTLHSPGSWCSAPCVHQGPWMSQATGRSRTVHMVRSSMSPGHPPQRWSRWGWVDGEEQPTDFHPSGIINRKTVFNWRKKKVLWITKPSNICLLRTFLVFSHTTPLPRKTYLFNLKTA